MLQGPGSCRATIAMLRQALLLKRNFAVQLLNYTKSGRPFMNTLQVAPLYNPSGRVTHYLGVVMARYLDQPPAGNPQAPISMNRAQGGALVGNRHGQGGGFDGSNALTYTYDASSQTFVKVGGGGIVWQPPADFLAVGAYPAGATLQETSGNTLGATLTLTTSGAAGSASWRAASSSPLA